jgi:hypothetical protein
MKLSQYSFLTKKDISVSLEGNREEISIFLISLTSNVSVTSFTFSISPVYWNLSVYFSTNSIPSRLKHGIQKPAFFPSIQLSLAIPKFPSLF